MASSGSDDFYELVRIILAKHYHEESESKGILDSEAANRFLKRNSKIVERFVEGGPQCESPYEVLNECLSILQGESLSDQSYEALDAAFEIMTSRSYKSDKGQYFTPRHVVNMCVEALNLSPTDSICDPACGSGAFLKVAFDRIRERAPNCRPELYGFDVSKRAISTARLMSYLAMDDSAKLAQLDSLQLPKIGLLETDGETIEGYMPGNLREFSGFDVIITNPPFAGDVSSQAFVKDYDLGQLFNGRIERDALFLERCIRLLKKGGRLAIVVPYNKASSKRFIKLRKWLLARTSIDAVVSLHAYTFKPHTSQKAAVIILRKERSKNNHQIAFYRSDQPGKKSNGDPVFRDAQCHDYTGPECLLHDLAEIATDISHTIGEAQR